ncbi:MAG: hypothetical protein IPI67_27035 [Myxococcales bacterium]|nr:hypothetical protein [Myxococcales bacterium]
MSSRVTTDTSVAMSLADLAKIEDERIEQEQTTRARAREQRAREQREAAARRLAEEAAGLAAAAEEQARRNREAVTEKARAEARERAAADVARIEADARARLELENAARAHELASLRVRRETGRRRREYVLGAALALLVSVGAVAAYDANQRITTRERASLELKEREHALIQEHNDAKRTDLAALDRRHANLLARPLSDKAASERDTAAAARAGLDARSPGQDGLRAFGDALDALQTRVEGLERLSALEHRHADLASWASSVRRTSALQDVQSAALAARKPGAGPDALVAYERALDAARPKLGERAGQAGPLVTNETTTTGRTCREGDPGCGLDGRPLF